MNDDTWELEITFDTLEAQYESDPAYEFPHDGCSKIIAFLGEYWEFSDEEFTECVRWSDDHTRITMSAECVDQLEAVTLYAMSRTLLTGLNLRMLIPR